MDDRQFRKLILLIIAFLGFNKLHKFLTKEDRKIEMRFLKK